MSDFKTAGDLGLDTDSTVVEILEALRGHLQGLAAPGFVRGGGVDAERMIARAYAMAGTACEEARMRYTEARARETGKFAPADIDRNTPEAERAAFNERHRPG